MLLLLVAGLFFTLLIGVNVGSLRQRIDRQNLEYQMIIEDDSIIIFDRDRFVGKVELQGQLDSLMIKDNE